MLKIQKSLHLPKFSFRGRCSESSPMMSHAYCQDAVSQEVASRPYTLGTAVALVKYNLHQDYDKVDKRQIDAVTMIDRNDVKSKTLPVILDAVPSGELT